MDAVLGQPDLSRVGCNQGTEQPSASTLCEPSDVVMDPTSSRLFVADTGNHRVLSWANTHRLNTNEPADLVLGQPDFQTGQTCEMPEAGCFEPAGLAMDGARPTRSCGLIR
jgi:NHL repeat